MTSLRVATLIAIALVTMGSNCSGSGDDVDWDPFFMLEEIIRIEHAAGTVFAIDEACEDISTVDPNEDGVERLASLGVVEGATMSAQSLIDVSRSWISTGGPCVSETARTRVSNAHSRQLGLRVSVGDLTVDRFGISNGLLITDDASIEIDGQSYVVDLYNVFGQGGETNAEWLSQPPDTMSDECDRAFYGCAIILSTDGPTGPFTALDFPTDIAEVLPHFNPTDAPSEVTEIREIRCDLWDQIDQCVLTIRADIGQMSEAEPGVWIGGGMSIDETPHVPIPAMPSSARAVLLLLLIASAGVALRMRDR